jgi:hypothetical protein
VTDEQQTALDILLERNTGMAVVGLFTAPPPDDADPNEPSPPGPVRAVLDGGGDTQRWDIATDGRVRSAPEGLGPNEGDWDTAELLTR